MKKSEIMVDLPSEVFVIIKNKEEKKMKGKNNPYATNAGGYIKAPKTADKNSPKATVTKGNDLRVKNNKK